MRDITTIENPPPITSAGLPLRENSAMSAALMVTAMPVTPAPAIPSAPAIPAYGKSPEVQIPLGSRPESPPIKVQMPMANAGQDVRDRGVAHIATGGLARA